MQLTVTVGESRAFFIFNPITLPAPAFLQNGEVMAPLSLWAEAKQGNLAWEEDNRTATLTTWQGVYVLTAGDPTMIWNGTSTALPTTPTLINGSLYVPLRSLAVACGDYWEWKSDSELLVILVTQLLSYELTPLWILWTLRVNIGIFLAVICWLIWVLIEDQKKTRMLNRSYPNCTEKVDPRFDTCPQCGTRIEHELPVPRLISCPYCSRSISARSTECPWCQKRLRPEVKPLKPRIPSTRSIVSNMIVFYVILLLMGVLLITGWNSEWRGDHTNNQAYLLFLFLSIGVLPGGILGEILGRKGKGRAIFVWVDKKPLSWAVLLLLPLFIGVTLFTLSGDFLQILGGVLSAICLLLCSCFWWIALQLSRGKWPQDTKPPPNSPSSSGKAGADSTGKPPCG